MSIIRKFIALSFIVMMAMASSAQASKKVDSIVIFGDSLSDIGNTTHLLKSLRQEESPGYLVYPFKVYVFDKIDEYAEKYHVPDLILMPGKQALGQFFDNELATFLANFVTKLKQVPVVPGDPYYSSHFSNGYVWNEQLAVMLGINMIDNNKYSNHAFGGSWAVTYDSQLTVWNLIRHPILSIKNLITGKMIPPSLGLVTKTYLMVQKKASPDRLYMFFSGGNDYLNVLNFEDNYNPAQMSKYVDNVLDGIESSMRRLIKAGAKHIAIFGVPDVGISPKFVNSLDSAVLTQATQWHNVRLEQRIEKWRQQYSDVKFTYVDIETMLEDAMKNPMKYGISNVRDACIDVKLPHLLTPGFAAGQHPFENNSVLQYAEVLQNRHSSFAAGEKNYHVCDNPDDYLFWDEVHPTRIVHKYLAEKVCHDLQANGYEVQCSV